MIRLIYLLRFYVFPRRNFDIGLILRSYVELFLHRKEEGVYTTPGISTYIYGMKLKLWLTSDSSWQEETADDAITFVA